MLISAFLLVPSTFYQWCSQIFPEPALYPPVHAVQAQQWSTWPSKIQSPWKEEEEWRKGRKGRRRKRKRGRNKSEGREERGTSMAAPSLPRSGEAPPSPQSWCQPPISPTGSIWWSVSSDLLICSSPESKGSLFWLILRSEYKHKTMGIMNLAPLNPDPILVKMKWKDTYRRTHVQLCFCEIEVQVQTVIYNYKNTWQVPFSIF